MIFYLNKSGISKNKRIWINWATNRRAPHWCSWKYLFTEGRHIPKTLATISFLKRCLFQTVILDILKSRILERTESELFEP